MPDPVCELRLAGIHNKSWSSGFATGKRSDDQACEATGLKAEIEEFWVESQCSWERLAEMVEQLATTNRQQVLINEADTDKHKRDLGAVETLCNLLSEELCCLIWFELMPDTELQNIVEHIVRRAGLLVKGVDESANQEEQWREEMDNQNHWRGAEGVLSLYEAYVKVTFAVRIRGLSSIQAKAATQDDFGVHRGKDILKVYDRPAHIFASHDLVVGQPGNIIASVPQNPMAGLPLWCLPV
ncbi:hypothetical protein OG21DRAFT_1527606 [Imleria badia]|nr:hypothetical protein OG21DRAFT_1527606 [Imleria badia]